MTDLRKAAEMAVDYIVEALARHDEAYERHPSTEHERQVIINDLEALRQALAQPEQECIYPECETAGGCDGPCGAAVKQEPVGWAFREHLEALGVDFSKPRAEGNWEEVGPESSLGKRPHTSTPLYTAPPKREWVGLTDEEIEKLIRIMMSKDQAFTGFARAIEAKLKEKNT